MTIVRHFQIRQPTLIFITEAPKYYSILGFYIIFKTFLMQFNSVDISYSLGFVRRQRTHLKYIKSRTL